MNLCKFNNLFTLHLPPLNNSLYNRRTTRFSVRFSSESTHRVKLAESLQSETLKLLEWPAVCQQLSSFTSTFMGFAAAKSARIPINNETQDLDGREEALKAKEAHEIQQEVRTVKNEIQTIVQQFESQLRNVSLDEMNTLVKKAEAAIASIVEAHQPSKDSLVREIGQSLYTPQLGEQVYLKAFGNKLATVIEEPGADETILVQYGKIRARVDRRNIRTIPPDASSGAANLKTQVQRIRSLRDLGSFSEANKNQQDSYGPVLQTSKNMVDLRGLRVEDASHQLNIAIDSRAPNSVIFINGMGTGVVKESALKLLRKHPRVVKFEQESPMNYGCTVAYIK